MSDWWWHLWNDPMRHNPWSLGALLVIVVAALAAMAWVETMMFRRRRKETSMAEASSPEPITGQGAWVHSVEDRALAEEAITAARDSSSRLATWSPDMDKVRELPPVAAEDDTVIQERQWAAEGIPVQPRMAARAAVPHAIVNQHREQCDHCGGMGYMPSISDHLRESIALLGDQGDQVVRTFYGVLFRSAPELARLFPGDPTEGDLGTDHKGAKQREKLLSALVALSDLYDPDDGDKMAKLDTALGSFGRSHAAFVRQDGTVKGATIEEYAAVKTALFSTLVQAAGNAWKAEYTESWSQAYDYAAAVMVAEQYRSGFAAPRFPRA